MILAVGEVLLDIFPEFTRIGGAPFNFTFHLKMLGIPFRFISRIGDDENGVLVREKLEQYGYSSGDIQVDDRHSTGRVLVEVNKLGVPSYMILEEVAYDYISVDENLRDCLSGDVDMIYYGTLSQRSRDGYDTIQYLLKNKSPKTKSIYDINLRKGCLNEKIIVDSVSSCDILKMNNDELKVLKLISGRKDPDDSFVVSLMDEYSITMVAVTRGDQGSAMYAEGKKYSSKPGKALSIKDTVGAGDAFAAILAVGVLQKWEPDVILKHASALSSAICTIDGAVTEDDSFYEKIRKSIKRTWNH